MLNIVQKKVVKNKKNKTHGVEFRRSKHLVPIVFVGKIN